MCLLRAYSELPSCSGVVLALPVSLCSTAPEFFTQKDNEVSEWVSNPSSVLGGEWCPRWNGDISFLLWSALFFQSSHTWLPLTGPQPHLDAASQPPPALADTTGSCLSHSECLLWPASSTSGCHTSLTQFKQCSCDHQIIVRAIWHQLRLRQDLPSTKHCPARQFNYNGVEILLVELHLTAVSKMK